VSEAKQLKQLIFQAREQRDGSIVIMAPDGTITVAKRDQPELIGSAVMDGLDNPPETQTEHAAPRQESRRPRQEDDGEASADPVDVLLGTLLQAAPGLGARLLDMGRKISYQGERKDE